MVHVQAKLLCCGLRRAPGRLPVRGSRTIPSTPNDAIVPPLPNHLPCPSVISRLALCGLLLRIQRVSVRLVL